MAVYKIFPIQDSTLYSLTPSQNTGLDAINQISNLNSALDSYPSVARSLIKFDTNEISNVLDNRVNGTWDVHLKSFIALAEGLTSTSTVEIFPVSQSWNNGTGQFLNSPITTDGVSWNNPLYNGSGVSWGIGDGIISTSSYNPTYSPQGGGNWYISSSNGPIAYPYTQTFDVRSSKDLDVIVTETIHDWYSGSIDNNGFILKWDSTLEFNTDKNIQPTLKYYSVDTNTIYPPQLEFRWDDFEWNPSNSIPVLSQPNAFVSLAENPGIFYSDSVNRFRLDVRPKYPARVWQTSSLYTQQNYLPSGSSMYAVKDLDTNEFIIDFDSTYTQISADENSSYFDIYMNGLEPERYYQILIQVTSGGSTTVYDDNYYFKVVNG